VFGTPGSPILRLSEVTRGDGGALYQRALDHGWEGLIAKTASSVYHTGKRTRDWRKLKIVHEQEFVVGGWTDPRTGGRPFGALLVGYYEDGRLKYAGHTGSGFNQRELERVYRLLKPLAVETPPFATRPRTNERPHWAKPSLVAQLRFTEWTDEGFLRHPIYLGLRDDVKPETVRRETAPKRRGPSVARSRQASASGERRLRPGQGAKPPNDPSTSSGPSPSQETSKRERGSDPASSEKRLRLERGAKSPSERERGSGPASSKRGDAPLQSLLDQLSEIEHGRKSGLLHLPDGNTLEVTNLNKVFWPKLKITKGELMRYYVRVSRQILPVVNDRPLIMKRFPNGIEGEAFYQQRAPEKVPVAVPTETMPGDEEVPSRLIGGKLITLLYTTQLAAISQDPWFSRVTSPHTADHCAIDLDPMPGVKFETVLDVARWVHDELEKLHIKGFPKTSGSEGLHIYIPLRQGTPYEAGLIFCQIIATMVAEKHPKFATVERSVRARGHKVYVDYLQNIEGKSLACAYSARATGFAGVSTPLKWKEIDERIEPADFTIRTLPDRLLEVGDLWAPLLAAKGVDLHKIIR
jgi:bifunctional non-homologous end joining protein LigD